MKFNETKSQERLINLLLQYDVEWPDNGEFAAQDRDGWVHTYHGKPVRTGDEWSPDRVVVGCRIELPILPNWHQTTVTREQCEARDGWVTWHGGERPVGEGIKFEFIRRDGVHLDGAKANIWCHEGDSLDIIAYRIRKQPAPVCESVELGATASPTIEQLIARYNNLITERDVQLAELDKQHDAVSEAEERVAEAAEAVQEALEAAGWGKPKEPAQSVINDWRDLRAGDVVECVRSNLGELHSGEMGKVVSIDLDDEVTPVLVNFDDEPIWCHEVKFISRP